MILATIRSSRWLPAVLIAVAWAAGLSLICRPLVDQYFPIWDEWAWLELSPAGFPDVAAWFTTGLSTMPPAYPAFPSPPPEYVRPIFHLGYWLLGAIFGVASGNYLYLNYAAIGACAGAAYACMADESHTASQRRLLLAFAAILPLMPCFSSTATMFGPLFLPMMAYDPLVAALALCAYLAYAKGRHALAAALSLAALLTKESALPLAVALPLTFAWTHRADLRRQARPLVLLLAPIGAWAALRLAAFGHVYSEGGAPGAFGELLGGYGTQVLRLPFHARSLSAPFRDPGSFEAAVAIADVLALGALTAALWSRWRKTGPDASEVTLVLAGAFLAWFGPLTPRYAALFTAFLFVVAARAWRGPRLAAATLSVVIVAMAGLYGIRSGAALPQAATHAQHTYALGRIYADALRTAAGESVVVVNDPDTGVASPMSLVAALGLPVRTVIKATDFPMRLTLDADPRPPCRGSVRSTGSHGFEFWQSCGYEVRAYLPVLPPAVMNLAQGVRATFSESQLPGTPVSAPPFGQRLELTVSAANTRILYFDPEGSRFVWLTP